MLVPLPPCVFRRGVGVRALAKRSYLFMCTFRYVFYFFYFNNFGYNIVCRALCSGSLGKRGVGVRALAKRSYLFMVLRRVLVDQSQPLLLRRLDGWLRFLGGACPALALDAKEDPQGRKGSITPLRCVNVEP